MRGESNGVGKTLGGSFTLEKFGRANVGTKQKILRVETTRPEGKRAFKSRWTLGESSEGNESASMLHVEGLNSGGGASEGKETPWTRREKRDIGSSWETEKSLPPLLKDSWMAT